MRLLRSVLGEVVGLVADDLLVPSGVLAILAGGWWLVAHWSARAAGPLIAVAVAAWLAAAVVVEGRAAERQRR